ncbi:hypothetical protein [Bradyrhizobium sp. RDI18]|uniref:hypothetical protein n=1 Tax=Bradyrhizobium sp. RDI18 TaxID=3367400 RepID=UPI00371E9238
MPLIYLSGPITGTSAREDNWRVAARRKLSPAFAFFDPSLQSPDRRVGYLQSSTPSEDLERLRHGKFIADRNRHQLAKSDVLLCNFLHTKDRVSIGSVGEIHWANAFNIPIIIIRERQGNVHDHAILNAIASELCFNLMTLAACYLECLTRKGNGASHNELIMYPAFVALFLVVLLEGLALLSDIKKPFPRHVDRLKAATVRLYDLISSPPFLRHWQFMRPFFSLTVAKLFITWFAVVPVAAHLLSKAPDTIKVPQNCNWTVELGPISGPDDSTKTPSKNWANAESRCAFLEFPIALPFNWQLLWFASFLFFMAFAIYSIACPGFIKRYPNYTTYLSIGHAVRWIVWEFHYMDTDTDTPDGVRNAVERRLITKKYAEPTSEPPTSEPVVTAESTYVVFRHENQNYRFGSPAENIDGRQRVWEQDVFWEVLGGWAKSRPLFARTIQGLLLSAGLITFYIICENIWAALQYIFRAI